MSEDQGVRSLLRPGRGREAQYPLIATPPRLHTACFFCCQSDFGLLFLRLSAIAILKGAPEWLVCLWLPDVDHLAAMPANAIDLDEAA
jgi:hypothetical protein